MDSLKLRNQMKARKPTFMRQDAHKVKRLERKWRRPKGLHSKMRHKFKGYRPLVSKGYKSPVDVRGLSRRGLESVLVHSPEMVNGINAKTQAIVIAKSVGKKKRVMIVELANQKDIKVSNVKNQKDYKSQVESDIKKRKEAKQKAQSAQAEKKEAKTDKKHKPKSEEKAKEETTPDNSEKEQQEKKDFDKLLTKQEK